MDNATIRRAMFQFQTTMLRQASQTVHELRSAAEHKELGAALATAAVAMAWIGGETYINHLNRQLKHYLFKGPAPKEHPISEEIATDMVRRIPVIGPLGTTMRDAETGIPTLDTAIQARNSIKHLSTGVDEYGHKISPRTQKLERIKIGTAAASAMGIPGASTFGEGLQALTPREVKY
jgi:hypothetical protein